MYGDKYDVQTWSHSKHSVWQSKKVVPTDILAGKDIMQIEMAHFEAVSEEHKVLKARFTKSATTLADGEEKTKEPLEANNTVPKEATPNVITETTEVSVIIPVEKDATADKPTEPTIVASPKTGVYRTNE